MAHELEMKKNGQASMFYVGKEKPWHTLGKSLNSPPTIEEGLEAAGLDWTVSVHEMESIVKRLGQPELRIPARGRMVVRDSDNKRLSEVGPDWTPLQNIDAFKWFEPFLESGEASLDTAGALFGGEKIWVLAKLNRDPLVIGGNDTINKYLLLSNAHSDKASVRPAFVGIRTVCWNTLSAGLSSAASKSIRVRHSSKVKLNLDNVRSIVNTANAEFEATAEQYRLLTKKHINQADLKKYVKLVFKQADEDQAPDSAPEKERREDDKRLMENKILPIFEEGLGSNLPSSKGTLFGAWQAINTFLNWERGRTDDARMDQLWFGNGRAIDQRAFDLAKAML